MLKKLVFFFVLMCFSCSVFALEPTNAVQSMREIVSELKEENLKSEQLIESLETSNEQMKSDLEEVQKSLRESWESQKKQIAMLENYGNLIDDQATYYRSLNKKLTFWRTSSIVFSVSLVTTVIVVVAVSK